MKYSLEWAYDTEQLSVNVTNLLGKGWQLYGSPFAVVVREARIANGQPKSAVVKLYQALTAPDETQPTTDTSEQTIQVDGVQYRVPLYPSIFQR
jgi:Domain of unknown function (DUF1737)